MISIWAQLAPAMVGLVGVVVGAIVAAWRQSQLQQSNWLREDLRRWRQDRRDCYLKFVYADDEMYRHVIRDLRDPPPGRLVFDARTLNRDEVIPPLSQAECVGLLEVFDRLWRAKREIELHHLTDDTLLAVANKLTLKHAELVGLTLFDLARRPDDAQSITVQIRDVLQARRELVDEFMQQARLSLNVPPGNA